VEVSLDISTFEDEATRLSLNVKIKLSWDAVLYRRRTESSVVRLI